MKPTNKAKAKAKANEDFDKFTEEFDKLTFKPKEISAILQNSKEIENLLKARKESKTENAFTFISWNIKHGNKGTAGQTRDLLNKILQDEFADIIALQESVWMQSQMTKKHVLTQDFINEEPVYKYIGVHAQAGFLFKHSKFDCEKVTLVPYPGTKDIRELAINEIFEKRCCVARFQVKTANQNQSSPNTLKFMIISYHGYWRGKDVYQKRIISASFLRFVKSYQEKKPFPIFVVGDFNCNLEKILENSCLKGIAIPVIDKDAREDNPIDFLTYFPQQKCVWRGHFKDVHGQVYEEEEKYEGMTNHYPVHAILAFNQAPPSPQKGI